MPNLDFSVLQIGARYDRPTLAQLWGYESFQAISRGVVTPRGSTQIILFVTRVKQASFTQFNDFTSGDLLYWEGESGHGSDDRIIGAPAADVEIHLFYREIHHTPFEYRGLIELLTHELRTTDPSRFVFRLKHDLGELDDLSVHQHELADAPPTEREALVKARLGQGRFRQQLLQFWGGCSVSGAWLPAVLRASHIKPWRACSNAERLDPANGLLLLPQYDSLFDQGYITFSDAGDLIVSSAIASIPPAALGLDLAAKIRKLVPGQSAYLQHHRQHVFAP